MKNLALIFLITLLLPGCAAMLQGTGHDVNAEFPSRISDNISLSFRDAIENTRVFPLKLNETFHSAIQLNDALIKLDGDRTTRYKIFSISGVKGKDLEFKIDSICSCLGFSKTIMPAKAYILSESGKLLSEQGVKFTIGYPAYYKGRWENGNSSLDAFYILVAFDSGSTGKSFDLSGVSHTGSGSFYLPMGATSQYTGEILVEVSDVEKG